MFFPLKGAIENRNINLIQNLIDLGADINQTDSEGRNALHWVVEFGNFEESEKELEEMLDFLLTKYVKK